MKKTSAGAVWNALGSIMWGMNGFVMLAIVSRFSTIDETGNFGIAFTTAQMLYIVGVFGVSHFQMTDYQEKYSFLSYIKIRIFSGMLMIFGCFGVIRILNFTGEKAWYTISLTLLMLLNVVGDLFQSLFFQKGRLDISGSSLFYRSLWPLMAFSAVLVKTHNISVAIITQIIVNFLCTLYYAVYVVPQFYDSNNKKSNGTLGNLFRECIPLFLSLLLMNVIINASKYGVDLTRNNVDLGYYNIIFMPAQVINLCSQFLFKPYLNKYACLLDKNDRSGFRVLLQKHLLIVLGLTVICCLGAACIGTPVLGFIYGQNLEQFTLPLLVIVFGGGIYAECQLFYYIMVILRQQGYILKIYTVSGVLTAVLSISMSWKYGLLGAAASFAVTHSVVLCLYIMAIEFCLRRKHHV